ncbi:YqaJ-like recombinase domain-containing protein [Terrimicrobium sacchariphilum]|uniref:YqaJ-like recombinase domain-containing protein n=1 Tax=Terrimicrobium sacchariphilum TaxID=690879 RepID=A0A146G9J1_TERSA|nr:lambda exonuclease family protein [Terrimicrobium sacchariphilum]GAT33266.1 YqaJ-like recombinase domain-containing protein [Terrimicrobium sacchariphilum]
MTIYDQIEQGSDEWKELRKGKPTASSFSKIITAAKGELSKSVDGYINKLIAECFCPEWEDWQGNFFTERGKAYEDEAREAFRQFSGHDVRKVGFCLSNDGVSGCSPDSLIYCDGNPVAGLEIKCPAPETHVGYIRAGVLPDDYKQQVHGSLAVTGLSEWHFWSYFPGTQPFHVVVRPDEYTAKLAAALEKFVELYKAEYSAALPKIIKN